MSGPTRQDLLAAFKRYDQAVDVVSAFHWLYTATAEMPRHVTHFERYPTIVHPDGNEATPDFSVLFSDGTGLVGEIAWLALAEESVDSLCRQLLRYESLTTLPTYGGGFERVTRTDVLVLVPMTVGVDAVRRILDERAANPDHGYSPERNPCIAQFAFMDGKYSVQRLGHPSNGALDATLRSPCLGDWLLRSQFNAPVDLFRDNKAQWVFNNDPVDPLYLASHLWLHVFSTVVTPDPSKPYVPLDLSTAEIAERLRGLYGYGRSNDVTRAMQVLAAAGCAQASGEGKWKIAWGEVRLRADEVDLVDALAARSTSPKPPGGPIQRRLRDERASKPDKPLSLFD